MSMQSWCELIFSNIDNGTAIANTTTETILFPNITIPARYFGRDRVLKLLARGKVSNIVTSPGTLTFMLRLGGVAGTILCQSEAIAQNTSAQTDDQWFIDIDIQTRIFALSGTILAMGHVYSYNFATKQIEMMGSAGGASGDTPAPVGSLDLTADQALSLTAKFQTANAGNTITGMQEFLYAMN